MNDDKPFWGACWKAKDEINWTGLWRTKNGTIVNVVEGVYDSTSKGEYWVGTVKNGLKYEYTRNGTCKWINDDMDLYERLREEGTEYKQLMLEFNK